MSAFFGSLKSDLLDRRLAPLLALLAVALLGAIAYAALAGGSSSPASPGASAPSPAPHSSGIAVSAIATTKAPVAETTSGAAQQTGGSSRNPFAPLPGVKSASPSSGAASSSSESSASGSSSGGSSGEAGSGSSGSETNSSSQSGGTKPERKKAAKPAKTYKVSVLFGAAAAGTPALTAGLTSYEQLQLQQPLPSAEQPLIVFRGVVAGGKSATFTLVGEAILRGTAACRPSASQCQAIDVKAGETEELEYVPLEGAAVNYELHVVKIEAVSAKAAGAASAASAASAFAGESKAGLKVLRESGLLALPGMRYSKDRSVLVFTAADRHAVARAHASA